ncbi:ABC transporter permease [Clostridium mediterraneense]|uniref:ABC transporter permease n=1 Tax=Clostridium mediterraneense TaxID=1805472 RepID=UPI000835C63E|nr:ABC transporter permease [Clostridium mediterraneense]
MKEFLSLVKVDLRIKYNTIFNSDNNLEKIIIAAIALLLLVIPLEIIIIKNYPILNSLNAENLIFNIIINIESLLIFIVTIIGISNNFFLEHDILSLWFYPLKSQSIFFSKCILEYLKGLLIGLIGLIFLITYGILSNWTIYYYLKAIFLTLIIPIICIIIILNTFLFISTFFTNIKKSLLNKIFFYIVQSLNIIYIYFYITNTKINFFRINNFISSLFFNKISFNFIILSLLFLNIILFLFYTSDIYLDIVLSNFKLISPKNKVKRNKNLNFKVYNILYSSIKRELKEILRTPILIVNAIIPNIVFLILIILITPSISNAIKSVDFFLIFLIVLLSITMTSLNTVSNFAFSRETNNLKYLRYLPLSINQLFISKIILAFLFNIINLISINILIISINKNVLYILFLNIIAILTMLSIILINITTDYNSIKKSILNLSDLFNDIELILKPIIKTIPLTLIYMIVFVFTVRINLSYNLKGIIIITTSLLLNILPIILNCNKIKSFKINNLFD